MANGPMAVLSDESQRTAGDDARSMNLEVARAVAEAVRTTLGPKGMDKMLIDDGGNVIVTNDGVTLLEEMDVDHPAADMLVEVASTQEADVGDGTTTAAIAGGELLSAAEELLDDGLHPTTIVGGYREAAAIVEETLDDIAIPVDVDDDETLRRLAETAMTGKGAETDKSQLGKFVVEGVRAATREDGSVDRDAVVVRTFDGRTVEDSSFFSGIMFDQNPANKKMPTEQSDADVLVYDGEIEVSEAGVEPESTVSSFDQYDSFVQRERDEIEGNVETIVESGADVVLVAEGTDDLAEGLLADEGITVFNRVDEEERDRIASATGATRVTDLDDLTPEDLGYVGRLEQERIRTPTYKHQAPPEKSTFFDDLPVGETGTILLRGGTDHALDEIERAVGDSIDVLVTAIEEGEILPGAGAPEMELSLALRRGADGIEGREQLAVEAFADAIEAIPRTLAENAGHDVVDALVELRASHDGGNRSAGLDADSGEIVDALEAGIVEPRRVKSTALGSAVDAATMILRIDDVVSAGDLSTGGDEN